jgi:hypothetical protein
VVNLEGVLAVTVDGSVGLPRIGAGRDAAAPWAYAITRLHCDAE